MRLNGKVLFRKLRLTFLFFFFYYYYSVTGAQNFSLNDWLNLWTHSSKMLKSVLMNKNCDFNFEVEISRLISLKVIKKSKNVRTTTTGAICYNGNSLHLQQLEYQTAFTGKLSKVEPQNFGIRFLMGSCLIFITHYLFIAMGWKFI